jgi:hypothetical protein
MWRALCLTLACVVAFCAGAFYPYPSPLLLQSASTSRKFVITTAYVSDTEVAASQDGVTWGANPNLPSLAAWGSYNPTYSVGAWTGTNFFIAAYNTSVGAISADGLSWSSVTLPANGAWTAAAVHGSTIVLPARNLSGQIAVSANNGASWSLVSTPSTSSVWIGAAWNGSVFAAIAANNNALATSSDGLTWTQRFITGASAWSAVAANGTLFLAAASGSTTSATSLDGITWTARTLPTTSVNAITSANGLFFLTNNTTTYYTSSDGASWTSHAAPIGLANVVWNGSLYLGMGYGAAATSPDGLTWTTRSLPSSGHTWSYAF